LSSVDTMIFDTLFDLTAHGDDVYVGTGPSYPWGGMYGGHIVAQALWATALTVDPDLLPHSLRAYFIRRGDSGEPVRYEVDQTRNGRSFATRRVVARQSIGAILNLEASFQRAEPAADVSPIAMPTGIPHPDDLVDDTWSPALHRRFVRSADIAPAAQGIGRVLCWFRVHESMADDELLHRCALAYMSDDLPADSVIHAHPTLRATADTDDPNRFVASLDHTVWFHRAVRATDWHLYDFATHSYVGGRGLSIGHIFAMTGEHVATVAQEVRVRDAATRGGH
jgi:acyl-CoA thioesterase II